LDSATFFLPARVPSQLEQRRLLEEQRTRLIQEKAAEMAQMRQSLQREKERDLAMVRAGAARGCVRPSFVCPPCVPLWSQLVRQREEEEEQRHERLQREQVEAQRNLAARVQSSTTEVRPSPSLASLFFFFFHSCVPGRVAGAGGALHGGEQPAAPGAV
jgi:hypothetical protein